MKQLLIISLIFMANYLYGQSYVGVEISEYPGFTLHNELELDSSFVIGGFKTVVSKDPVIKLRAGFKIGTPKLHTVLYLPVMNYSLKEGKYNTPFNFELRYNPDKSMFKEFKFVLGVEIYQDGSYPYLNIMVPFKANTRVNKPYNY